jgi:hypothetical protein
MRNRAQPFMKVALARGASMLSVEVNGQAAKPVEGKDGIRVPLLRPGFRPDGVYRVSFVYLNAGTPFAKKGDMQMALPKMDVPVNVLEWELFVPDRYRVGHFDGNVLAADLWGAEGIDGGAGGVVGGVVGGLADAPRVDGIIAGKPGQIVGRVVDQAGAAIPGATVTVEGGGQQQAVVTDANGAYSFSGLPSGPLVVSGQLEGFVTVHQSVNFDQRSREITMALAVAGVSEAVTVRSESPTVNTSTAQVSRETAQKSARQSNEPSLNVQSLQRRASGVLPVRMEVPRAGTSHRFVKPLVVDEPATVSFRYKRN